VLANHRPRHGRADEVLAANLNLTAAFRNEVDEKECRELARIDADIASVGYVAERQIAEPDNILTHAKLLVGPQVGEFVLAKDSCNPLAGFSEVAGLNQ